MKIEKNKLVRISNNEKHNENVFELCRSDVILDSIRVYLTREFEVDKEIDFAVYRQSEPRYKIVLGKMLGKGEGVWVTYEYLRTVTILTIDKDDWVDMIESDNTYTFSLETDCEMNEE